MVVSWSGKSADDHASDVMTSNITIRTEILENPNHFKIFFSTIITIKQGENHNYFAYKNSDVRQQQRQQKSLRWLEDMV